MSAGAVANLVFLTLHSWLGSGSYLVFAAVAAALGVYSWLCVPETKGKTLAEVQQLLGATSGEAGLSQFQGPLPHISQPIVRDSLKPGGHDNGEDQKHDRAGVLSPSSPSRAMSAAHPSQSLLHPQYVRSDEVALDIENPR